MGGAHEHRRTYDVGSARRLPAAGPLNRPACKELHGALHPLPARGFASVAISEFLGTRPRPLDEIRRPAHTVTVLRDLLALTKPRVTSLVLLTGAAGMYLAPGEVRVRT